MKILVATNNVAKVNRFKKLLNGYDVQLLTPKEVGIEAIEIEENDDINDNSRRKGQVYFGLTDLPILSDDTAFTLEGESLPPARVKRNALGEIEEKNLSQEELTKKVLTFYSDLVKKRGEPIEAAWLNCITLLMPSGELRQEISTRTCLLTGVVKGDVDPLFPIRSMYIVKATGKYVADQTDEEEQFELKPIKDALVKLLQL